MTVKAGACKACGKKKCKAKIGPYGETKCKKGSQAHHVPPDYTKRKGTRPTLKMDKDSTSESDRIGGISSFNQGTSICLKGNAKTPRTEHNIAHNCDNAIADLAAKGDPIGTVSLQEAIEESIKSAAEAKPECEEELRRAVDKEYGGEDRSRRVRGVQDPRKLSDDAMNAFNDKSSNIISGR